MFSFFKPTKFNYQIYYKNIYQHIDLLELWSDKINFTSFLKEIDQYNKNFSKIETIPSSLSEVTRGILIAIEKHIWFVPAFDYESGYNDLFSTLNTLFEKSHLSLDMEAYRYLIPQDADEVEWNVMEAIEKEINNKLIAKHGFVLLHSPTGDQSFDFVIIKKEKIDDYGKIFPDRKREIMFVA